MRKEIRRLKLDEDYVNQLMDAYPELANEILNYGENAQDVLRNNYLVSFNLLTEGNNVISSDGRVFDITRNHTDFNSNPIKLGIEDIYNATKWKWWQHIKHPVTRRIKEQNVNNLNQFKVEDINNPTELGYIPLMSNHSSTIENKYGFFLGETLKKEIIDGVMTLRMDALIIKPYAKAMYLQGLFNEVSPSFNGLVIKEGSFVVEPAQSTNISFSKGEPESTKNINILEITNLGVANLEKSDIIDEIAAAKANLANEKIKSHENLVQSTIDNLISNKIVSSGMSKNLKNQLINFSAGELGSVVKIIKSISNTHNPFFNKPKTIELKGSIAMLETKDQRYLNFAKANPQYTDMADMQKAFEEQEAKMQAAFSTGAVTIADPKAKLIESLKSLKDLGQLEAPEIKDMLGEYGIAFSAGEPIDTPSTPAPVFNAGEINAATVLQEIMDKGIEAMRIENAALKEENATLKAKQEQFKNILG